MPNPLIVIDADQQNSAVLKNTPQNDRWRAEQITPRQGLPFTLIVVADGEGSGAAGQVADQAVGIAFAEATLRRDDPLTRLLRHLVSQMNEVVSRHGSGGQVGITLGAIQGDMVWLIQAGSQTRCYRVRRENSVAVLTSENDSPLGRHTALPSLPVESHKLKRGDKLIFCTDGLFAGDLVTPADLGRIDRYQDIKGASRHLSATAMGRNVNDNVTVVVAAYGHKSRWPVRVLIFDLLGVIAAILIIAVVAGLIANFTRVPPRPPDLGIAVLAEGQAVQVEPFQIIYPGSDINAMPDSTLHLILKRRASLQSGLTTTIPGVDLYLGRNAFANLTSLDVQGYMDAQNGVLAPTNLTELRLYSGSLLLLSRQERTFYVRPAEAGLAEALFMVLKGSEAALGVTREENSVEAYCLRGSCSLHAGRDFAPLTSGSKVSFPNGSTTLDHLSLAPMEEADWKAWQELCTALQGDLQNSPASCQMAMP